MISVPVLGVLGRLQSVLTVKEIATSDTTQVSGIKNSLEGGICLWIWNVE